jgi:hypothetical protein
LTGYFNIEKRGNQIIGRGRGGEENLLAKRKGNREKSQNGVPQRPGGFAETPAKAEGPEQQQRGGKNEQGASVGGHAEGCVHPECGRKAEELESQRAVFCGVGNLSPEGVDSGPEPVVCVAVEQLVRAGGAALG